MERSIALSGNCRKIGRHSLTEAAAGAALRDEPGAASAARGLRLDCRRIETDRRDGVRLGVEFAESRIYAGI